MAVNEELMRIIDEAGMRLSEDALRELEKQDDAVSIAKELIAGEKDVFIITPELVRKYLRHDEEEHKIPMPVVIERSSGFKPAAAECEPDLKYSEHIDDDGGASFGGKIEDFVNYFNSRYRQEGEIIRRERHSEISLLSIDAAGKRDKWERVRVAGIVNNRNITKNGNVLIELEDETGVAKVIVRKEGRHAKLFAQANTLLTDEIISVVGANSPPFIMADDIIWPEVPMREQRKSGRDLGIAFISDVHVASRQFLEDSFKSMVRWLNGNCANERERETAGKIKYLLIAGDVVDGIGVYPEQERELVETNIYEQYAMLSQLLEGVPDYVEIVLSPGNHDAARRAEPQPALGTEIRERMPNSNLHFIPNPSTVEIEGLKTLIYHGTSLDSIIANMPGMDYHHPAKPMLELLRRRHLSPIYGENPIVPEMRDRMVIKDVPDIVHMGHIHKNDYLTYRGVSLINSGTWQGRTDYQRTLGHVPTPCLLPVFHTAYARIEQFDFTSTGEKRVS